ncbi:MAG: universal stress protein [Gemmataceae bacterium]
MYRTILVPLDGSVQSELSLPLASTVARAAKAELKLVHVASLDESANRSANPSHQQYLDGILQKVRQESGVSATCELLYGPVAETLAACAVVTPADLIVMTTHGRGPLSRLWLGSVADSLVRRSTVPLLLLRPGEKPQSGASTSSHGLHQILIALDGSPASETAIAPALALGRLFDAEFTLLRVVEPVPAIVGDGATYAAGGYDMQLFEELLEQAKANLSAIAERLRADGLTVTAHTVVGGSPGPAILDAAKAADLTAVATHGRSATARLFLGSVADKVIRGSEGPVLLVRCSDQ